MRRPPPPLRLGNSSWEFGSRTYLLGIVNVTPDSFSGDGLGGDPEAALERALALAEEGADAIDVGGESTRPRHQEVPVEEELRRVVPAIRRITASLDLPVFVDTSKAEVARQALAAGAVCVNDVWGLRRDAAMAEVAAEAGAAVVVMHNQEGHHYSELLAEVLAQLHLSLELAEAAGIPGDKVVVDPGLGFGKVAEQSLELLAKVDALRELGRPVLVGSSRKSMVGALLDQRPVEGRLMGTAATVAWAAALGADVLRVHDVAAMRDVVRVVDALRQHRLR